MVNIPTVHIWKGANVAVGQQRLSENAVQKRSFDSASLFSFISFTTMLVETLFFVKLFIP